jgi:hypothetical protein
MQTEMPNIFFLFMFFGEPAVHFSQFFPLLPLTEVSPRPSAIPGGNSPGDGQSAVGWGDAGFEPGTAGQQSGALPLSHHASRIEPPRLPWEACCRIFMSVPFLTYTAQVVAFLTKVVTLCPILYTWTYVFHLLHALTIYNCLFSSAG